MLALVLACAVLLGATTRLYLKDGSYQVIREYKVEGDRVRYYSTERGDWEEIPLNLVDLKKTESENRAREEDQKEEAAMIAAEDRAEREAREELEKVPVNPGVYLVSGKEVKTVPLGDAKVVGDKKRSILKAITPVPLVSGKGTLELDGERSKTVVDADKPEFYIRLLQEERFGIVKLGIHKGNRVVEEFNVMPVTNEIVEKMNEVPIFRKQMGEGLYKIWPREALEPGEYAVVEYTPAEDRAALQVQTWDFSKAQKK